MSIEQEIADYNRARRDMTNKVMDQIDDLSQDELYRDGYCIFCDKLYGEEHYHSCAYALVKWMKKKEMY